jgi:IclR family acetate operon transcriptional repressor
MTRARRAAPGAARDVASAPVEAARAPLKHLERAFAVLEALLRAGQPMRLTDLTSVAGLDASGTLRLIKMMADLGYVVRHDASKTYVIGAKAAFPLGLFHPFQELRRDATELLLEIQRETSVTSALQIFLGGERILLELRHGSSRLTPFWDTTIRSALHASATGKLLLLSMSAAARRERLGPGPFERFTDRTIVQAAALEVDLRRTAQRGWSSAIEEAYVGMSSVAAPLRASDGTPVGAVIATGMARQLDGERLQVATQAVTRAAGMLSTMSPAVRALEPLLMPR